MRTHRSQETNSQSQNFDCPNLDFFPKWKLRSCNATSVNHTRGKFSAHIYQGLPRHLGMNTEQPYHAILRTCWKVFLLVLFRILARVESGKFHHGLQWGYQWGIRKPFRRYFFQCGCWNYWTCFEKRVWCYVPLWIMRLDVSKTSGVGWWPFFLSFELVFAFFLS